MKSAAPAEHRAVLTTHHHRGRQAATRTGDLKRRAFWATVHWLAGCAAGKVLGLATGTLLGWGNLETLALAVGLAFVFGYALIMDPSAMACRSAAGVALPADTASTAIIERGGEPDAVSTPAAPQSDAATFTNAYTARRGLGDPPRSCRAAAQRAHGAPSGRTRTGRTPGRTIQQPGTPL